MFELHYSTGGHGGPYRTLLDAKLKALRLLAGNPNEKYISVVHRKNNVEILRLTQQNYDEFFRWGLMRKKIDNV